MEKPSKESNPDETCKLTLICLTGVTFPLGMPLFNYVLTLNFWQKNVHKYWLTALIEDSAWPGKSVRKTKLDIPNGLTKL